jgi:uncharacterized protein (TIGR03435 family)
MRLAVVFALKAETFMRRNARYLMVVLCLVLAPALAPAQTKPSFEVATVRPTTTDIQSLAAQARAGQMPRVGAKIDGARAEYIYVSLKDLIVLAYKVKPYQITGPGWLGSERFDIAAKIPDGASRDEVPQMLQSLLEERFKLVLHRETKEHAVLALVVGKGGPRMKESAEIPKPIDTKAPLEAGERIVEGPDGPVRMTPGKTVGSATVNMGDRGKVSYGLDPATRSFKIDADGVTMSGFADMLSSFSTAGSGAQVKDMTGLTGHYQVAISFSLEDLMNMARSQGFAVPNAPPNASGAMPGDAASTPAGSSLFDAVHSMGLNLEQRKAMVEQLVIDSVEKTPTAN